LLPARYTELPDAVDAFDADGRWLVDAFAAGARDEGGLSHGGKTASVDK
jgi:hypothetical protein